MRRHNCTRRFVVPDIDIGLQDRSLDLADDLAAFLRELSHMTKEEIMDCMRKTWLRAVAVVVGVVLSGCATTGEQTASGPAPATGASARANAAANTALYQSVNYANASTKGPMIIVLPGEVKSNNATFTQRYFPNNIADYAELELSQANFQVLDRANLGSVLREMEIAYNLGDPQKAQALFQKGALQSTRWIIKFDVLRAEKVAEASSGFSGSTL